jgi:hypothetical protein
MGPKEIIEANVVVVKNSRIAQTEKSREFGLLFNPQRRRPPKIYLNKSRN